MTFYEEYCLSYGREYFEGHEIKIGYYNLTSQIGV